MTEEKLRGLLEKAHSRFDLCKTVIAFNAIEMRGKTSHTLDSVNKTILELIERFVEAYLQDHIILDFISVKTKGICVQMCYNMNVDINAQIGGGYSSAHYE